MGSGGVNGEMSVGGGLLGFLGGEIWGTEAGYGGCGYFLAGESRERGVFL